MDARKWHRWDRSFLREVEDNLRPFLSLSSSSSHPKLVVGVSGGADSLVLLHCLKRILGAETLLVAHVNHQLRPDADADAAFVAEIAEAWEISFLLRRVDVAQLATEQGVEEAGRNARYAFFAEMADVHGATAVSVAHNGDDQAETVLLHLLRGAGLAGLRGMQPVGRVPRNDDLLLLRPFLHTSRADIETYAQIHQLHPREDVSNQDTTYFRNQIRHDLIPFLQQYTPHIKGNLQQLSEIVAADYDFLQAEFRLAWERILVERGDGWVQLSRQRWQKLPLSQKRMALRAGILQIRPLQTEISFEVVEQARQLCAQNASGTQMNLPGKVTLFVDYTSLYFVSERGQLPANVPQIKTKAKLPIPGKVALQNGWQLEATVYEGEIIQAMQAADKLSVFVDVGDLAYLDVRGRMRGERIRPFGLDGHATKLKKVMINRKIAHPFRVKWPIIANETYPIWLVGHIIDQRVKIKDTTQRIVQLRCFQNNA